jgi:hypothetical protein
MVIAGAEKVQLRTGFVFLARITIIIGTGAAGYAVILAEWIIYPIKNLASGGISLGPDIAQIIVVHEMLDG